MKMRYELKFNTDTTRYEIVEIAIEEDGNDVRVNGHRMVRQVITMSPQEWDMFTYTWS
jgi:hypothetical protein